MPSDAATLADGVVVAVRDGIASGELEPGTTYSVYQLADLLGVSRSPVREGLLRLAEVGLVQINRNRGFVVRRPSAHDVEEIAQIRLALEPDAAARAAAGADDDALDAVKESLEAMRRAVASGDEAAFWPADRALHHALLHASGNARAAAVVEQLRATTALLGPPTTDGGRTLEDVLEEHLPVVDAVLARDPERARTAMRAHLESTRDLLLARFD